MRILNDNEELALMKQKKLEERDNVTQNFEKDMAIMEREMITLDENGKKREQEINAELDAECAKIKAVAELENQKIVAETQII